MRPGAAGSTAAAVVTSAGVMWITAGRPMTSILQQAQDGLRRWTLVVCPPREARNEPIACVFAPLPATVSAPVCLERCALTEGLSNAAVSVTQPALARDTSMARQKPETLASCRPAVDAVVDRGLRPVRRRGVAQACAALQHVSDARQHAAIIDAAGAGLVRRHERAEHRPRLVRQP